MAARTRGSTTSSSSTTPKRKKTTKAKGSTVKAKKEEVPKEVLPEIPGVTEPTIIKELMNLLKENFKIEAICKYRIATGKTLEEATNSLEAFWRAEAVKHINTDDYKDKRVCISCVGFCGKKAELIKQHSEKLYDMDKTAPCGTGCSYWGNEDTIKSKMGSGDRLGIRMVKQGSSRSSAVRIRYDKSIIQTDKGNSNVTHQIVDPKELRDKIIEVVCALFLAGHKWERTFNLDGPLTKNGIPTKAGESWDEYVGRIAQAIRDKRKEVETKFHSMSEEDMLKELRKFCESKGIKSILDSYGDDIESFLEDYFPEKPLEEILTSLHKEQYR